MDTLSLENPVFATFVIAAAVMVLKAMLQGWMTVFRMLKVKGGFVNPEDAEKSPMNPEPSPAQIEKNEYVERSRRMHANDVENIPFYLVASFLFVVANPPLLMAQICMYGYVGSRALHFLAYVTAQKHDVRATFWTVGSLIVIYMAGYALWAVL